MTKKDIKPNKAWGIVRNGILMKIEPFDTKREADGEVSLYKNNYNDNGKFDVVKIEIRVIQ